MPTRPKKGGGPQQHAPGTAERGGQKAVVGSGRSPEVAGAAADAAAAEEEADEQGDEGS